MIQVNIKMNEMLKKRIYQQAIEKGKTLQDTIIEYIILGMTLERNLETNKSFKLPKEFEIIKTTIELDK